MKTCYARSVALVAALLLSAPAAADDNFWFGLKAGTLGLGAEASWRPIPWLDARVGANVYDYDDTANYVGIEYDGKLALQSYYATANFHFPVSPFRITAGAFANGNEIQMTSVSTAGVEIGGNPAYTETDIGTLTSTASFDSFAPYLGVGFDFDIVGKFGLALDFGVLWQGEPSVALTADGLLASDPAFLADLDNERLALEDEFKDLKAYPVISVGFNFNFL